MRLTTSWMRRRVASLTISGRCSARDTVATDTLAMAAISLTVLTRAGGAAFVPLPPCRPLDAFALNRPAPVCTVAVGGRYHPPHPARARRGRAPAIVSRLLLRCNVMDYMKIVAWARVHLIHAVRSCERRRGAQASASIGPLTDESPERLVSTPM